MTESAQPLSNPVLDLPREKLPRHIAAIMDGNGRWAERRELPRIEGHRRGVDSVRSVTEECARLGIEQLTLYCLSSENWKRPPLELDFLMQLLEHYLIEERSRLMNNNLQLKIIGRREPLPDHVQQEMDKSIELTASNTGTTLCLAINYGSRAEIVDAVKSLAAKAKDGELEVGAIDEQLISDHLYTANMPDPDLLIRTAGEMRVSNYLLWQISYAELWVTEKCWPDFGIEDLHASIREFANRVRRYGGLS